jgi:LPXTG-motif cell wall-anchored protein
VIATAAFSVPIVFAAGAGASPSASPHHHTSSTVCSTTTTLGATTTTTADTTTTIADTTTTVTDTTTTIADTTTTEANTSTTASIVGGQSAGPVVQLGSPVGGSPVTLPVSAQAAAATQLPRTGSSSLPAVVAGLVLLVTGALAASANRRRRFGNAGLDPEQR